VTGDGAYPWAYPRSAGREGSRVASVPRHSASFWLDRRFAEGPLAGFEIGAGLRHVGATWNATNLFDRKYFAPGFYEDSVFFGNCRAILGTFTYSW
jgi:iron complex outermembrane receptor protein